MLAVGDGALGFWGALREVFPTTREQRCWVHETANCLDALPKRLHPRGQGRRSLASTAQSRAPTRSTPPSPSPTTFAEFEKATAKITDDLDVLLAFYDFPDEHWLHLRTTNPIESTFSTVRLRTRVTRGAGSRKAALAMAYKLLDAAQDGGVASRGAELVPLVRAGATFIDGKLQERRAANESTDDTDTGSVAA